jgi:hypothetical protein
VPNVASLGLLNATVTGKGGLTGNIKIDGVSLPIAGSFDNAGVARFGVSRATVLTLKRLGKPDMELAMVLDMTGVSGRITGSLTQKLLGATVAVSTIVSDRAHYSSSNKVAIGYVGTVSQRYNLILPPRASQTGLTTAQFPQGTGIGSMIVKVNGTVTFTMTLADNTGFTATAALSKNDRCPLFGQLYALKGCFAGAVALDGAPGHNDAHGMDCLWVRPARPTVQWYPLGWPDSILVDVIGGKFIVPPATPPTSVIPGLGPVHPTNGNATLTFLDGLLINQVDKNVNISPANFVTKVGAGDASFTLTLTKATGEIGGTFTHSDGKKPTFKATTIQKPGDHQGTHGFFMTAPTAPLNLLGQSGAVKLLPK